MRLGAAAVLCAALVACSSSTGEQATVSPSPAETLAADLRTRVDLLLAEQVMIVAKQTAAAVSHDDAYDGYAALLAANSSELGGVLASALGNTASAELMTTWNAQDGYLVDYAIGVITHDDAKAKAAMLTLTGEFAPRFGQQLADAGVGDAASLGTMLAQQTAADKAFIDAAAAQSYGAFYAGLHTAYAGTAALGDALATGIALRYPDKFPGDLSHADVNRRVALNLLLQESSYTATLATDAVLGGRPAETAAAVAALAANTNALSSYFPAAFLPVWTMRTNGLLGYARGDPSVSTPLTVDFVRNFAAVARIERSLVSRQLAATLGVIGDQRGKAAKQIAGDDRAAAAAMQPIADAAT